MPGKTGRTLEAVPMEEVRSPPPRAGGSIMSETMLVKRPAEESMASGN